MNGEIDAIYNEAEAKAKIDIEDAQLRKVMNDKSGRAFVYRMLNDSGMFRAVYGDVEGLSFMEGRRVVGVNLMNDILRVCPDLFSKMIQERNANE
jgi:hypothetical protein